MENEKVKVTPLVYLKKELKFALSEWTKLSNEDKDSYKAMAEKEIELLGLNK